MDWCVFSKAGAKNVLFLAVDDMRSVPCIYEYRSKQTPARAIYIYIWC